MSKNVLVNVLQKLGLNVRVVGSWTWFQFAEWGNWWLGVSIRQKAAGFSDVKGRWFFIAIFPSKSATITILNGERIQAVNRQGYPQPYLFQRRPKGSDNIGKVVLTLTPDGELVVQDYKRAHGYVTQSPRASLDNPKQPIGTKLIPLSNGEMVDPARVTAERGLAPNIKVFAQVFDLTTARQTDSEEELKKLEPYYTVSVEKALQFGDQATSSALGHLMWLTQSTNPKAWVKWIQEQSEKL